MKLNAKDLIASARENFPMHGTVLELCLELESQLYINEHNLTIKQNLAEENRRLREQMAPASGGSSFNQQLLEQMVGDLRTLTNPQNPTIPPLSPECLRQHAAIGALQGLLASRDWHGDHAELASNAVIAADALVQELAK